MKSLFKFSFLSLLIVYAISITSCKDDDPIIDPGADGINVSDGLYLAVAGQDPTAATGLVSEVVEAEGFAAQERTGFTGNYMYLASGEYNLVNIVDKEITATFGGASTDVTDEGSLCDQNTYSVVSISEGGAAFNIANDGLYKITNDELTEELVIHQIATASIIGSATENGWGADTPLTPTITETGATFTADDVILRSGEWKVRFNCRWSINRRIDPNGSLDDAANGYQSFTNFGGTTNSLETGGANIQQDEDGLYTVTAAYNAQDGWSLTTTKTGEAPEVAFNPNDFNMAVIGDATASAWDSDQNLFHKENNGVHSWYGVVYLAGTGFYKFRANDLWDFNLGGDLSALSQGGDDIPTPGEGAYYVVLSTADEGDSWNASVTPGGWAVIGEGGPGGDWENDQALTADGFDMGITTYSLTGDFTTASWKLRAGNDWALNLGGDLSFLTVDGADINLAADGTYTVTLQFDGAVYTATVQ